jgi:hypothetical protein
MIVTGVFLSSMIVGAVAGGFVVFKFLDFVSTDTLSRLSASCANLNDQVTYWKTRAAMLDEIEEAQNRKETPEQWRERNLKTKYEQIEHEIRASELAYTRYLDKLARLKKIRDAALHEHPDLQNDIEYGFDIYSSSKQEVTDEPSQNGEAAQRY